MFVYHFQILNNTFKYAEVCYNVANDTKIVLDIRMTNAGVFSIKYSVKHKASKLYSLIYFTLNKILTPII